MGGESDAGDGYFPHGRSLLRHVHEQRAVGLLYGQRALAIGALMPLNFIGTRRHSRSLDRPFERLTRTAKAFETIFFGSRSDADRVLGAVHRMHQHVRGELPDDAGRFPAGTPYSAFDPSLMLWTVAVMADSAQVFYELLVRRLSNDERDRLWDDYVRFGELFGMPRSAAPATHAEFRAWFSERLASDDVHLTPEARRVGRAIMFEIPVPPRSRPAMRVHNLVMLGSLPERVRAVYGLPWTRAHAAAFQAFVRSARLSRPLVPGPLRSGRNTWAFEDVARAERRLVALGRPVPGAMG
ncbi:MAG TPA: oxygenase MpaB family protein [Thermoleophilaceae bacterium]|nr:oxygenase MpaB family protein [Thermoleophilaceae bacterium]